MQRVKIGVVGCGLIAQIMHLPHLRELPEYFQLSALCDVVPDVLARVAADYSVLDTYNDYQEMLSRADIDAVMILSSGDHAPVVLAALEAGKHVFVEKPLCFTQRDADLMIAASEARRLCLMVGYMKWFDPVYEEAQRRLKLGGDAQLVEITTIFTPEEFYFRHHRLHRRPPSPGALISTHKMRADTLATELPDIPPHLLDVYLDVLLDSAIHDLYVLRGLVGDPKSLVHVSLWAGGKGVGIVWQYSPTLQARYTCLMLDEPGGQYKETVTCYSSNQRLRLDFPSPYLRNMPTSLHIEEMAAGSIAQTSLQFSYEEAFKRELVHFHECICTGEPPRSSAREGKKDIALMQEAIRYGAAQQ